LDKQHAPGALRSCYGMSSACLAWPGLAAASSAEWPPTVNIKDHSKHAHNVQQQWWLQQQK